MKKFDYRSAIHALGNSVTECIDTDTNEPNGKLIVTLPLSGLNACSALDYLKHHTSVKIIVEGENRNGKKNCSN